MSLRDAARKLEKNCLRAIRVDGGPKCFRVVLSREREATYHRTWSYICSKSACRRDRTYILPVACSRLLTGRDSARIGLQRERLAWVNGKHSAQYDLWLACIIFYVDNQRYRTTLAETREELRETGSVSVVGSSHSSTAFEHPTTANHPQIAKVMFSRSASILPYNTI